ncbi:pre-peptidase C-terminal domain-containing protein [Rubrivirga sp.]|uniref:pre-peptidase C-terminal domain-containing protein n=1 Tax=Rubrivirga sp. TaxID=1885344 RepID=UPI003C75A93B
MRTLTAISLSCLLALPALAQQLPVFPADQFGNAVLVPARGAVFYESTFNDVPNFEPLDDFTDANRYRQLSRSVGRLDLRVTNSQGQAMSTCTATLIADDILITNYHCVPGTDPSWQVTTAQIRMGYMTLANEGVAYPVDITPLESNRSLDYAILRVPSAPGQRWGHIPLRVRDPSPGEELFLMHHPQGVPQRLTRRNCRIKDGSASVSGIEIRHRCDTQGGSSGSLIFSDNAVNGQFEAVGLHYAGFGPNAVDPYNSAKRMTSILAQSPLLQRLASGSPAPPRRAPGPTPRPPTQPVSTGSRTISASATGRLTSASTRHTFDGQAGDVITVDLTSGDFDPILDVLGPDGQTLATDDDGGGSLNSRVTDLRLATTGTYTFVVRSYQASDRGATGAYDISISGAGTAPPPPRPTPPPASPSPRTISASTSGTLTSASTRHTFDGQAGDVVTITLESQEFDPILDVLSPTGETIATNDDGVGLNSRVSDLRLPSAGTYTLVVRSYAGGSRAATGQYTVSITGSGPALPATSRTTHALGQSRAGTLEVGGRSRFTFTGRAGQQIWAEVTSGFDSFLTLTDPDGRAIATDDDAGEGTDARISASLPTSGTYTITVSAYTGADYPGVQRSGSFTLRLGEGL